MPEITDPPPPDVVADLLNLRLALDGQAASLGVPPKRLDHNLVVGTWNLRAFGGLTKEWQSGPRDSPKRDLRSLLAIAEIVSRFDVLAIQEIKGDLRALRHLLKWLNHIEPAWALILTDVTAGRPGNDERLGFVFDTRRVQLSGLAGEIVIPEGYRIGEKRFQRQFARTPYAVAFRSRGRTFILVTLHVLYGKRPGDRVDELTVTAHWLMNWAVDVHAYDQNLIALGDFNIDRHDDPLYRAFTSTGLQPPPELWEAPRTIFGTGATAKHYDQIAWFGAGGFAPALSSLRYLGSGGYFDFVPLLQGDLSKLELSWRVSDHYPLWVEFAVI